MLTLQHLCQCAFFGVAIFFVGSLLLNPVNKDILVIGDVTSQQIGQKQSTLYHYPFSLDKTGQESFDIRSH